MGVTIEQWRCAIGNFHQDVSNNTKDVTAKALKISPQLLAAIRLLLLIDGVEPNPGPNTTDSTTLETSENTMYLLGQGITTCDQKTEIRKQACYMYELGEAYIELAGKTSEGWHFIYATALFNAALQRIEKTPTINDDLDNVATVHGKPLTVQSITDQLERVETYFLKTVSKVKHESTARSTERYKKHLDQIRTFSAQTITRIHNNDMQVDSVTSEMSDECEKRLIENSRKYYDNLTTQIKEFHATVFDDCINVIGDPPCKFVLLGLGSLARKEVTAWSDLESAIIYDPTCKTDEEINEIKQHFRTLTHYFHMKVINLGETRLNVLDIPVLCDFNSKLSQDVIDNNFYDNITKQGLCFDGTLPKASKTPFGRKSTTLPLVKNETFELIMTVDEMASCQEEDISIREGYHLSDVLLTSTVIRGDETQWNNYNSKAHEIIASRATKNPSNSIGQDRGLATLKDDLENYDKNPLTPESFQKQLRTKHTIYRFATISINILKLIYHCRSFSPLDILEELQQKHILSERAKKDLQVMVSLATNMRHLVYSRYGQQQEIVSFLAPTSTEEGIADEDIVSVRDFSAIYRFCATFFPWSEFLKVHSTDLPICGHAPRYFDNSDNVKGQLHKEMLFFDKALEAFEREEQCLLLREGEVKYHKAELYELQGKFGLSMEYHRQSLEIYKKISGNKQATGIARALYGIGKAHRWRCDYEMAINSYEQSLIKMCRVYGKQPQSEIATILSSIGDAFSRASKYDMAIQYHEESLEMFKKIPGERAHSGVAQTLHNIGNVHFNKRDFTQAIEFYEKSLKMKNLIYGNQPHPAIADTFRNIGAAYNGTGDHDQAIKYFNQSFIMGKKIFGDKAHPSIADTLNNFGVTFWSKGNHNKAVQYYDQSLDMWKEILEGSPHPNIADTLNNIGIAYWSKNDNIQAIQYYNRSLDMWMKIFGNKPHQNIADTFNNIGAAYSDNGDYNLAIESYNRNLEMDLDLFKGEPNMLRAETLNNLGVAYSGKGDHDLSIKYYNQSLDMGAEIFGDKIHPFVADTLENIGTAYSRKGDTQRANQYYDKSRAMRKQLNTEKKKKQYQHLPKRFL